MHIIRLIVGLGNPGKKYVKTRHNIGAEFVKQLAQNEKGCAFQSETRFHADIARILATDIWLLLPQTFMNLSGQAVVAFAQFHKLNPKEILVVHDELDFIPGVAKLKFSGGVAGHNGLKDIAEKMGSTDFWRLRIGIGHPGNKDAVADYVLHPPLQEEQSLIKNTIVRTINEVWPFIKQGNMEAAMKQLHTKGNRE